MQTDHIEIAADGKKYRGQVTIHTQSLFEFIGQNTKRDGERVHELRIVTWLLYRIR